MRPLTDAQFWGGTAMMFAAMAAIVIGFLGHWHSINKDILKDEKQRLTAWARQYAAQLAEQKFREYVRSIRINVPVELINESDIDWGDSKNDAA